MQFNSYTSDHRWYLIAVLEARIILQIGEILRLPGWAQGILVSIPSFLPDAAYEGKEYAMDVCETKGAPVPTLYFFSWLNRNWGNPEPGCPFVWRWVWWYIVVYVWFYHYTRPLIKHVSPHLPKGPVWSAIALASSMTLGVLMAMFHYPNLVLENGTGIKWAWLEIGIDFLQPALFILGMTHFPFNLTWWGNTTLGCYAFHFYFKDTVGSWMMAVAPALSWDFTGLLMFLIALVVCISFTTILGPIGHAFLTLPVTLPRTVRLVRQRLRRPQEATSSLGQVREIRAGGADGSSCQ
jgi:hypothetical protein